MSKQKNALDSLTASSDWVERLLDLFWAVAQVVDEQDESVPESIAVAYDAAESARKEL
jgi:hypothetical protein